MRLIKDGNMLLSCLYLATRGIQCMLLLGLQILAGKEIAATHIKVVAVATCKGIAIWHLGLKPDTDGRISSEKVALLSGHDGEVWQLEWDMSGMTLATSGSDGMVRLWQSNLNGVWHEQATLDGI
ncbi:SEH1 protein [Nymphaea thermarum]|nr:SEH1 protein [Nymphaea thermarum]